MPAATIALKTTAIVAEIGFISRLLSGWGFLHDVIQLALSRCGFLLSAHVIKHPLLIFGEGLLRAAKIRKIKLIPHLIIPVHLGFVPYRSRNVSMVRAKLLTENSATSSLSR